LPSFSPSPSSSRRRVAFAGDGGASADSGGGGGGSGGSIGGVGGGGGIGGVGVGIGGGGGVGVGGDDDDPDFPTAAAAERPRAVWRTVTAAVLFFVTGSLMLFYGVQDVRASGRAGADPQARERGLAMLVVGALTFLPGSYAVTVLLGARLGWRGYSFDSLPSYDEE
jgi:hypothetical protein